MFIDAAYQNIAVTKLAPQEVQTLLNKAQVYILDVRPLDFERDTSFLLNARHCPLVHLAAHYTQIPRDQTILITDWAMKQSPMAAKFLLTKGYTVAGVLQGGVERWKAEQCPVENRRPPVSRSGNTNQVVAAPHRCTSHLPHPLRPGNGSSPSS